MLPLHQRPIKFGCTNYKFFKGKFELCCPKFLRMRVSNFCQFWKKLENAISLIQIRDLASLLNLIYFVFPVRKSPPASPEQGLLHPQPQNPDRRQSPMTPLQWEHRRPQQDFQGRSKREQSEDALLPLQPRHKLFQQLHQQSLHQKTSKSYL